VVKIIFRTYNRAVKDSSIQVGDSHFLMGVSYLLILSSLLLVFSACSTQTYQYKGTQTFPVRERAQTQSQGEISISASVPGQDEAKAIFGIPIYKRGIQPVWIEIVNNSGEHIRFAPTAVDQNYFSPLEVAYMHRKGFSKEARAQMDRRFYDSAMPRQIPAGETRSGYVFSHLSPGTKSFNIDLFSGDTDYNFAFFITVPGFVPDHADVDFDSLYSPSDIADYDLAGLKNALVDAPMISTDQSGLRTGIPVGIAIVADGIDVLKALLRGGWYESPGSNDVKDLERTHYLFGRKPDATFRIRRNKDIERNKLYLWLAPMRVDGKEVWMVQVAHFIGRQTALEQALSGSRINPNIDSGREFFMQNMWYSQSLEQLAWLKTGEPVSIDNPLLDFNNTEYFTDGELIIIWLSGAPVSLSETRVLK
jgi:hypothetical protein